MFRALVKNIAKAVWRTVIEVALILSIIQLAQNYGVVNTAIYLASVLVVAFIILVAFAWYNYNKLVKQYSETLRVDKQKAKEVIETTFAKGVGK